MVIFIDMLDENAKTEPPFPSDLSLLSFYRPHESRLTLVHIGTISQPRSLPYWPFVTAFNFTHVQPEFRSVVVAIFAVFWRPCMS
jgi:hypothetical protein